MNIRETRSKPLQLQITKSILFLRSGCSTDCPAFLSLFLSLSLCLSLDCSQLLHGNAFGSRNERTREITRYRPLYSDESVRVKETRWLAAKGIQPGISRRWLQNQNDRTLSYSTTNFYSERMWFLQGNRVCIFKFSFYDSVQLNQLINANVFSEMVQEHDLKEIRGRDGSWHWCVWQEFNRRCVFLKGGERFTRSFSGTICSVISLIERLVSSRVTRRNIVGVKVIMQQRHVNH